jgi:hypothetical protein
MTMLGYTVLIVAVFLLLFSLLMAVLTVISMRRGHFYMPWLLRPGLIIVEGIGKMLWRMGRIDSNELILFTIRIHNQLNREKFSNVPSDRRLVFLPQCLRSASCPACLSPEGIQCVRCMRCEIGKAIDKVESLGTKVFICPGSTFVKRMIKKYRPEAIVGVGCIIEVKEGLEMAESIDLLAMGVVTSKDGCVETLLDWDTLFEVLSLQPKTVE